MEKVVRDGKVAVLVSHGFGAGWFSWHHNEKLLYEPNIVGMLLDNRPDTEIEAYAKLVAGEDDYLGGIEGLRVEWVEQGKKFRIDEYDGNETLMTSEMDDWMLA